MIPRVLVDRAEVPGGGELRLIQRGQEFSIMLGANELMNSRLSGSEEALATIVAEKIAGRPEPCVLIGGLGMGFTLRAALTAFGKDARILVAELVPAVVRWAQGPMAEIFGGSLRDPRVAIVERDVADLIDTENYDAILLDVDNGPDGLTRAENDRLYSAAGLARARQALRLGGVLAIWSSAPDKTFTNRLKRAGFAVDERAVRANKNGRGGHHVLWFATKI